MCQKFDYQHCLLIYINTPRLLEIMTAIPNQPVGNVTFRIKRAFSEQVIEIIVDPNRSIQNIFLDIINTVHTEQFPDIQDRTRIQIVPCGWMGGQPEHCPTTVFDITRNFPFTQTNMWDPSTQVYTWYSRVYHTECAICMDNIQNISTPFSCIHAFCSNCIATWLNTHHTCPTCRANTSPHTHNPPNEINNENNPPPDNNHNNYNNDHLHNIIRNYIIENIRDPHIYNMDIIDNNNMLGQINNLIDNLAHAQLNNINNINNLEHINNIYNNRLNLINNNIHNLINHEPHPIRINNPH